MLSLTQSIPSVHQNLAKAIVRNPIVVAPQTTVREAIGLMSQSRSFCPTGAGSSDGSSANDAGTSDFGIPDSSDTSTPVSLIHSEARSSCVIVQNGDTIVGILTERDMVRLCATPQTFDFTPVNEVMTTTVRTLREVDLTDLFAVIGILQQNHIRHLPVVNEQGNLVGLVTHETLRQLLQPIDLLRLRLVKEVMAPIVIIAEPNETLLTIVQRLAGHRVSCVVVVELRSTSEGNLSIPVGIVTERDVVQFRALELDFSAYTVAEVMSTPIVTIAETESLVTVQQLMEQYLIRRVVVTGTGGELRGILTQSNVLQALSPLEIYHLTEVLEAKIERLETEKVELLKKRNVELERTTRLKDEFLANMSHELRTPLNSILGMSEALQEQIFGLINEQQLKALRTVENSATHLLTLINDILDVAKIEAGQVKLEYSYVSIEQLCSSSIAFITQQAFRKRIQLNMEVPKDLPAVFLDEVRMRQVLLNLLNNAVKFTLDGGTVTVRVSVIQPTENSVENFSDNLSDNADNDVSQNPCNTPTWNILRITVEDTGIGIATENLNKLFKPFVQIDGSLNRQQTGTGLGLTLVKKLVELHGGQVNLSSELGRGSCFTIDLPYVPQQTFRSSARSSVESRGEGLLISQRDNVMSTEEMTSRKPFILLAEDDEANVETISCYLQAKGYEIFLAYDGQHAIDVTQLVGPDLIVMDIQMPGMDGLAAIKVIRQLDRFQTIPIIALTALAMKGDQERCLEAGANLYLSKPVKLKQLDMAIKQLLSDRLPD